MLVRISVPLQDQWAQGSFEWYSLGADRNMGTTYFAAMFGFLFAGFGLSNMVVLIFGAAARRFPGGVGAAIAAAASVGYLGFLVGPPVVGSLSGVVGLRAALALVVVAGVVISLAARTVMAETA
jgi:MFS family permease